MTNDVAKPKDPMQEFQEKLQARVRADIADLLPESAIEALVQKAIDSEFFTEERYNAGSSYHPEWRHRPSAFQRAVTDAARPMIEKEVARIVELKMADIEKAVADAIVPNTIAILAGAAAARAMEENVYNVVAKIITAVRNGTEPY